MNIMSSENMEDIMIEEDTKETIEDMIINKERVEDIEIIEIFLKINKFL